MNVTKPAWAGTRCAAGGGRRCASQPRTGVLDSSELPGRREVGTQSTADPALNGSRFCAVGYSANIREAMALRVWDARPDSAATQPHGRHDTYRSTRVIIAHLALDDSDVSPSEINTVEGGEGRNVRVRKEETGAM